MNSNGHTSSRSDVDAGLAKLLSGDISAADARAIKHRIDSDTAFRADFEAAAGGVAVISQLADDPELLAVAEQPSLAWAQTARRHWPSLAAAAGLLVVLGVSLLSYFEGERKAQQDVQVQGYATYVGEQRTVTLSDGSAITLNTGTRLVVEISDSTRRVALERGEAFFQVEPDPQRPFSVDMGDRSVTVLGTEFNIFKSPDQYRIAVVKGLVAFHKNEESVAATAPLLSYEKSSYEKSNHEQSSAGSDGYIEVRAPAQRRVQGGWVVEFDRTDNTMVGYMPADIDSFHSWRTGLIGFYKEPLYKVVQELNRYSSKKILIEDTSIMELGVYGTIDINELNSALIALEKMLPIKVTSHFDRIVITGAKAISSQK